MKVAILTGGFPSSDNPSKSIFNLRAVKGLQKHLNLTVYHYRFWRPGRPVIQRYHYEGVNVVAISLPIIPLSSPFSTAFFDKIWMGLSAVLLKKELKTYDIFYSIGLGIAPLAASLASLCNKKHVSQAIGSDLLIYLPKKEKYFGLRKWTTHTQEVVCNSLYLKDSLKQRYPKMKATVAYRGTNLSDFSDKKKTENVGFIRLLFLGGFSNRGGSGMGTNLKGGETLKLVIQSLDTNDDMKVIFRIGGPESDSTLLKKWRETLKHSERVELLGLRKPDEIPGLMESAEVVLVPSLSEGLPNVGMEACASGCLLIGSNVGGIPEIITHNISGLILEAGNTVAWSIAIADVIANFNRYKPMIEKSTLIAKEKFDAKNYPKKLLHIIKSHYS